MEIRSYSEHDVPAMVHIWNEVVEEGIAFPQHDLLFATQTHCAVADGNGKVMGFIFCTRTMLDDVVILQMQVMLLTLPAEESTLAKSWFRTVGNYSGRISDERRNLSKHLPILLCTVTDSGLQR